MSRVDCLMDEHVLAHPLAELGEQARGYVAQAIAAFPPLLPAAGAA